MAPPLAAEEQGIIERLVAQDDVRWWNKPNLRRLYLLLVPFCLFIESTSGFDSSMMNGMQALEHWKEYFGHPKGGQLGLLVACYNLGAITSIPFVSLVSDHFGRRKSIIFGSVIMCIGAIMQGLSQNRKLASVTEISDNTTDTEQSPCSSSRASSSATASSTPSSRAPPSSAN
jgi:MFS family permease